MRKYFLVLLVTFVLSVLFCQKTYAQDYVLGFATAFDPKTKPTYLSSAVNISLDEKLDFDGFGCGRTSSFRVKWARKLRETIDYYNPDMKFSFITTGTNFLSFKTKDEVEAYKDSYEDAIRRNGGRTKRVSISNNNQ